MSADFGDVVFPKIHREMRALISRELFEQAARKDWPEIDMTREGDGYRATHTQRWWEGWQLRDCA